MYVGAVTKQQQKGADDYYNHSLYYCIALLLLLYGCCNHACGCVRRRFQITDRNLLFDACYIF